MDTINIYEKVKFKNSKKKFSDGNIFYNADKKFTNSNKILKSVEKIIPLASEAFSKSHINFLIKTPHYLLPMEKDVIYGMLMKLIY